LTEIEIEEALLIVVERIGMCEWLIKERIHVLERMADSCGKKLRMLERRIMTFCVFGRKLLSQTVDKA